MPAIAAMLGVAVEAVGAVVAALGVARTTIIVWQLVRMAMDARAARRERCDCH